MDEQTCLILLGAMAVAVLGMARYIVSLHSELRQEKNAHLETMRAELERQRDLEKAVTPEADGGDS